MIEVDILFLRALRWCLPPERMCIVQELRTLLDLQLRRCLRLLAISILLDLLRDLLYDDITVLLLIRLDRLGVLRKLRNIDLDRHEGAVLLDDLTHLPLVIILETIIVQVECDGGTDGFLVAIGHLIFCTAVAGPVNRRRILLIRQGVDVDLICDHEDTVEAEAEVSDDLIIVGLILILVDEVRRTGEGNLIDILLDLLCGHTDTVILEGDGLMLGIDDHIDSALIICRLRPLADEAQLLQLRDRITCVGDLLTYEDILIGIHPLLDDREYVFRIDRKCTLLCHTIYLLYYVDFISFVILRAEQTQAVP